MGEEHKDGALRRLVGWFINMFPVNRVVAFLTPVFAIAAGWAATQAATYLPGLLAFFVAGATAALVAAWQWLRGYASHEENEAMIEVASGQPLSTAGEANRERAVEEGVTIEPVAPGQAYGSGTQVSAEGGGDWFTRTVPHTPFVLPSGEPVVVSPDRDHSLEG
jgi:hypothetical protein